MKNAMKIEVRIFKNEEIVKKHLKKVSSSYSQDFLLGDTVFIEIFDLNTLYDIMDSISIKKDDVGYSAWKWS